MNNVIVIGSINMDIVAFAERHPSIGETVVGTDLKFFPGGKGANQAVASAKAGGKTTMIGKVGEDVFGGDLVSFLQRQGIDCKVSFHKGVPTGTALITVSILSSDNTIVVVPGANYHLRPADMEGVPLSRGDVLVSQFEIPTETITAIFSKGRECGTVNILNPAPARGISDELINLVDILILNETELQFISGLRVDAGNEQSISEAVKKICRPGQTLIVTLGEKGAIGFTANETFRVGGRKVDAVDTTGAGDCFVGSFASRISAGKSIGESISFANAAASICVTREGAGPSMPTLNEINQILS